MSAGLYARVLIPLANDGRVELVADIEDMALLDPNTAALLVGLFNRTVEFAQTSGLAEVEEVREIRPDPVPVPEPEPADEPEPVVATPPATTHPLQPQKVPCPDCGKRFVSGGLGVHRARAHGEGPVRPRPARPVRRRDDRVCAEDGCETVLSQYNKRKWCALHEGLHVSASFGRTA